MTTLLEQAQSHRGLGANETPELRALPWDKGPSEKELRQQGFMDKLGTWGTVLTVVGGAVGIYASLRALGWLPGGKG